MGERTNQGVARLATVLGASRPQVLLLMEGVNDLNALGRNGIAVAITSLERMIKTAKASGVQVMIATLPPQRPGGQRAGSVTLIEPFNSEIKKTAADEGAIVVDVYAGFGGDLTLIGADGLHPTELGYQRIAETFFASIKAGFEVMSIQSFSAEGAEQVQSIRSLRPQR